MKTAVHGCGVIISIAVATWPAVWYFSQILRNRRNPSNSNYHMSINNCQAIQKICIDRPKVYAQLRERDRGLGRLPVTVFFLLCFFLGRPITVISTLFGRPGFRTLGGIFILENSDDFFPFLSSSLKSWHACLVFCTLSFASLIGKLFVPSSLSSVFPVRLSSCSLSVVMLLSPWG